MANPKLTHDEMVANILCAYDACSAESLAAGAAWYRVAHDIARMIGNGDARKGAGVIAALSPQTSWEFNVKIATEACAGNLRGQTARNIAKAAAILDGADPEAVLPMDKKTGHFFRNIADPSDPDAVTVDRHAAKIAWGDDTRGSVTLSPKEYAAILAAYIDAGKRRGVLANIMQAAPWCERARGW